MPGEGAEMTQAEKPHTPKGYWGRILSVDLGSGKMERQAPPEEYYRQFLGGVGLGARILYERMPPQADPLGPENILGFTTGLLTDTGSLFTGRFTVVAKSPVTRGWSDSNCGGYFSPYLKRCGLDAVFISGISPAPVYLLIEENQARLIDAAELTGLDTIETEERLKARHGKTAQVASIGPSGEKLSLMAGIATDGGRMAGRSGLGAVMGSKRLKAVVVTGKRRVKTADAGRMKALSKQFASQVRPQKNTLRAVNGFVIALLSWLSRKKTKRHAKPGGYALYAASLAKFGTPTATALFSQNGDSPVKNWSGAGAWDFPLAKALKIGANAVSRYETKKYGCFSCPLRCGATVSWREKGQPIEKMHRPEYETLCAFGTLTLNHDLESIFRINDLVNRAGLDSISTGAVVAFAIECFENGLITAQDTGGLELGWGQGAAILELTRMIANREGFGDILADGVREAAKKIGPVAEEFAVHIGGVEAPMHDPKFDPGYAAAYAFEPTPGQHTIYSFSDINYMQLDKQFSQARTPAFSKPKDRYLLSDKGPDLKPASFYKMVVDCLGVCVFGVRVGGPIPLAGWVNAATGWELSNEELLRAGERVEQLRHVFNLREGINPRRDFKPHPRLTGERPLEKGPNAGVRLDMEALGRSFYLAMGWDWETGRPDKTYLEQLGLGFVNPDIHPG